ncbi:MAG TPA: hypothetical protein VK541_15865 [Pedobacter sp.]|uniref:hypothetical protein n=1 Tax=Pedobacter sp. TaxID=1411316 RepID=UPI002C6503AA|nr:hypothetical protein [Pedobacter sp.]HMI03963.1 hypothetical protein [Pedobacter sp.]
MKILYFILIFLSFKSFSQEPINYIHCNKSKAINYVISGSSSLKITNLNVLKDEVLGNKTVVDFLKKYKDSTKIGIVSSLIIIDLKKKENFALATLKFKSDFEINNVLKTFLEQSFNKLTITGLNNPNYTLGVYTVYNTSDKKLKVEFVERIKNKNYLIYSENYDTLIMTNN